jgi:UDP-N-acetylmuramoyl-tripeptide--D-alanyl-D-alanine ligase
VSVPLPGRHVVVAALAALGGAHALGVPLSEAAVALATLERPRHRMEVRHGERVTVIDDSYNANPTATRRAIDVLAGSPAPRHIAVIGEMLELGDRAEELHADVGRAAATAGLDALFAVGGGPARALADAAVTAGMPADAVRHFATSDDAADAVTALLRDGDLVLVKGSRGIKTDRVVERLKSAWGR